MDLSPCRFPIELLNLHEPHTAWDGRSAVLLGLQREYSRVLTCGKLLPQVTGLA